MSCNSVVVEEWDGKSVPVKTVPNAFLSFASALDLPLEVRSEPHCSHWTLVTAHSEHFLGGMQGRR